MVHHLGCKRSLCRLRPINNLNIILVLLAVLCAGQTIEHPPPATEGELEAPQVEEEGLQQRVHVTKDERNELEQDEETSHFSGLSQDHHGVWIMETYQNFAQVLKDTESGQPHGLLLVLLYTLSDSCKADHQPWLSKLESAADYVHSHLNIRHIQFGSLDTAQWEGAAPWLAGIGVETTPTLIFVVARNFEHQQANSTARPVVFLLDYIGPLETPDDIGNTVLQYYTRIFLTSTTPTTFRPFSHLPNDFASQIVPIQFPNLQQVQHFWLEISTLTNKIAASVQNRPGGVSQHWNPDDQHYIRWLMSAAQDAAATPVTLFVQCQAGAHSPQFTTFAEMAWILSSRRDVWFAGITDQCPPEWEPGQVGAFPFPASDNATTIHDFRAAATSATQNDVRRFLVHHSTPPVLWFDRYATAPIAFADDYQVHLLLLVNLHPLLNEVPRYSQQLVPIVQDFHRHCQELQRDPTNTNVICLIVPGTETRILNTFGIDFWSPLDARATGETHGMPPPTFPVLLITDRRPQENRYRDGTAITTHAVRRYLLRPMDIFKEHAVATFVSDFWHRQLLPELRSTSWQEGDVRVNKFGVTTLTALEFQQRFQTLATTQEHALVLFTQPSCGHCKRFHSIYNEACQIIKDVRWDAHMAMYKVEILPSNEVQGIPLPWLPDVYYFPPNSITEQDPSESLPLAPVRYNITDQFGNGVGRISDPLELIDWWLSVMVAEGKWMDPDVLLNMLDSKEDA